VFLFLPGERQLMAHLIASRDRYPPSFIKISSALLLRYYRRLPMVVAPIPSELWICSPPFLTKAPFLPPRQIVALPSTAGRPCAPDVFLPFSERSFTLHHLPNHRIPPPLTVEDRQTPRLIFLSLDPSSFLPQRRARGRDRAPPFFLTNSTLRRRLVPPSFVHEPSFPTHAFDISFLLTCFRDDFYQESPNFFLPNDSLRCNRVEPPSPSDLPCFFTSAADPQDARSG